MVQNKVARYLWTRV